MNLLYIFTSGKNFKVAYYIKAYARMLTPRWYNIWRRKRLTGHIQDDEKEYIQQRVNYYNKLTEQSQPYLQRHPDKKEEFVKLKEQKICNPKVYYFDTQEFFRCFKPEKFWKLFPGDVTFIPTVPAIVKSRPIDGENQNSVVMNLDKIRHFIFVKDTKPFTQKQDVAIFRGKVGRPDTPGYKQHRYRFMQMYWHSHYCNVGEIGRHANPQWLVPKMTIRQHLDYKFIICLEGNDVASNLKWVMSSNSLAVMPKPTFETWFMEGKLIPNVHYVEIKPDYSDLKQKMDYYIANPHEAQKIIDNAHAYVEQFKNKRRERIISLLVMEKYLNFING
jgi:hypothetical protein